MSIGGGSVDTPRAILVGHVEVDSLLEEHRGALSMAIERCNVHQRAAILGALEDARLELVGQYLDDVRVPILGGQVHRSAICWGYNNPHP